MILRFVQFAYKLKSVWAICAALLAGALLIVMAGSNPLQAYGALFKGAFAEYHGIATTLVKLSPLLLTGLAVIIPLRAGLYNIGGEGQMYIGALASTLTALYLPELPFGLHIVACSIAGMCGGGLWAGIPAFLKAYRGTNEVIVTLLLNYVAINIVSYAVNGPLMEEGAPYPYSPAIPGSARMPYMLPNTDAHLGAIIAIGFAVISYVVFTRTSVGFSLLAVGENSRAAELAGISVKSRIIGALVVGGAMAGLAGTYEVIGLKHRLFHLFGGGYGYDGIVVAFLASGNPLWAIVAALFLGGMRSGANFMQRAVGVPTTVVEAIQGLIVVFVAMSIILSFKRDRWARILKVNDDSAPSSAVDGDS